MKRKGESEHVQERLIKDPRQQPGAGAGRRAGPYLAGCQSRRLEKNSDESIQHLHTAVMLRPSDANTLYNATCTYGVPGKKVEALETFEKAFVAAYANRDWAADVSRLPAR